MNRTTTGGAAGAVRAVRRQGARHAPLLLAASGWLALAATALPATPPAAGVLRAAAVTAFLLTCPGAATVRLARPALRRDEHWSAAVLAVATSAALTALTTETLYLAGQFTATRVLVLLAALTTALTLLAHRGPPAPHPAGPDAAGSDAAGSDAAAPRRRPRRGRIWAAAALLTATAACGGPAVSDMQDPGSPAPVAATAPVGEPPARPPAAARPWHSVFHDDFTGRTLDPADWTTCYDWNQGGCTNAGNKESEWYRPGQVTVADGALTLTATRRPTTGSDGKTYPWTSGMVSTGRDHWDAPPRHTFTYGYVAAAIQAPADATGTFPAFWLLPAATRGGLPEIDIAEFINSNRYVDLNLHGLTPQGRDTISHQRYGPADFAGGYHVFGVDWEPDGITWYVDGTPRFQVTDPDQIPRVPMELLINLAVGFEEAPPAGTDTARLHVAWVGVWQH
ncbi:family 16 glycosylhydrolase [Kitasatospora phosalacinea]|uniref:glycoside hydrolase family 16 protein n=1 Tax=Kitasatospora phosalacinea TaxID=2065 RepID=UPI00365552D4